MMTRAELARLKQRVWQTDSVRPVRIYALLDCARDPSIYDLVGRSYREKSCLFAGKLDLELERAAPFLLELQAGDNVTDEILLRGWDAAWGILIRSEASFRGLRRHLRTFLRVRTEAGKFLLFRYYDPRVLNAYLPTCTAGELGQIFSDEVMHLLSFSSDTRETRMYTLQKGSLGVEAF